MTTESLRNIWNTLKNFFAPSSPIRSRATSATESKEESTAHLTKENKQIVSVETINANELYLRDYASVNMP
ncbi:hypothetical protein KIN20_017192 [Parelaphostrongylus tenuis]|uniref:Uncharacterized protein n=1 Tax=Parelaphostrongylus tenuis TaxID=148309 RepID=A0AAD5MZM5_PARTN|nr:hypothetical protein KIN20_017192 [Parelaphostrongylus tenuis]